MPVLWQIKQTLEAKNSTKYQTGSKALVPLNLGSHILHNKNSDNVNKRPKWSKGTVTNIDVPGCKYTIQNDAGKNVTRTRCDIRPDGSDVTNSGSLKTSRSSDCQNVKCIVHLIFCWKGKQLSITNQNLYIPMFKRCKIVYCMELYRDKWQRHKLITKIQNIDTKRLYLELMKIQTIKNLIEVSYC